MLNPSLNSLSAIAPSCPLQDQDSWPTFEDILYQLHQNGIYLHPHQLAEFLLRHGLPVDLQYVPSHLKEKAIEINTHYQGDMVRLENKDGYPWYSEQLCRGRG